MKVVTSIGTQLCETVAYGDAAGLPVETKSAEEIRNIYGTIDRLMATNSNPFFRDEFQPGTISDDTQLTVAVAEALTVADGFKLDAQAEAHITAYHSVPKIEWKGQKVPRGWGGSTTHSVVRLIHGMSPTRSGEPGGAGNGILMKQSPLTWWHTMRGIKLPKREQDIEQLTRMTHDSSIAVACSATHAAALEILTNTTPQNFESQLFADTIFAVAERYELEFKAGQVLTKALGYLRDNNSPDSEHILAETDAKGFYAPQTLAMAYGAFLQQPNFPESVWTAVNLGGDTDSIASIVGSMSLFLAGSVELPADASYIVERPRLRAVGQRLVSRVLNEGGMHDE